MKRLLVLGAIVALSGCAAQGRDEILASKTALKACLAQHAQDVKACDAALIAFHADLAAYEPATANLVAAGPQRPTDAVVMTQPPVDFAPFAAR